MGCYEKSPDPGHFLKATGKATAAVSVLASLRLPHVHAQGSDQIKIALIGRGGRGGGAAKNALSVSKRRRETCRHGGCV